MKRLAILAAAVLVGCGAVNDQLNPPKEFSNLHGLDAADPSAEALFREVLRDCGVEDDAGIDLGMAEEMGSHWGRCYFGTRTILLSSTIWPQLNQTGRYALMAHELGHCLLDVRTHANEGLMATYLPTYPSLQSARNAWLGLCREHKRIK